MTTDNFYFYLQNRLIRTSQTGGQWYSDTSPFSIPWSNYYHLACFFQVIDRSWQWFKFITLIQICSGPFSYLNFLAILILNIQRGTFVRMSAYFLWIRDKECVRVREREREREWMSGSVCVCEREKERERDRKLFWKNSQRRQKRNKNRKEIFRNRAHSRKKEPRHFTHLLFCQLTQIEG